MLDNTLLAYIESLPKLHEPGEFATGRHPPMCPGLPWSYLSAEEYADGYRHETRRDDGHPGG